MAIIAPFFVAAGGFETATGVADENVALAREFLGREGPARV